MRRNNAKAAQPDLGHIKLFLMMCGIVLRKVDSKDKYFNQLLNQFQIAQIFSNENIEQELINHVQQAITTLRDKAHQVVADEFFLELYNIAGKPKYKNIRILFVNSETFTQSQKAVPIGEALIGEIDTLITKSMRLCKIKPTDLLQSFKASLVQPLVKNGEASSNFLLQMATKMKKFSIWQKEWIGINQNNGNDTEIEKIEKIKLLLKEYTCVKWRGFNRLFHPRRHHILDVISLLSRLEQVNTMEEVKKQIQAMITSLSDQNKHLNHKGDMISMLAVLEQQCTLNLDISRIAPANI